MALMDMTREHSGTASTQSDIEPAIAALLDRKRQATLAGEYLPRQPQDLRERLHRFFEASGNPAEIANVRRLNGGGCKEQFLFDLTRNSETTCHVLRLDPLQSTVETDRRREYEILHAMRNTVPVPPVQGVDGDGSVIGRPALIMSFMPGATQPTEEASGNVSGMNMTFTQDFREALGSSFIENLAALHLADWRAADLPSYAAPDADPRQAARWQVNWWSRVWRDDQVRPLPAQRMIEHWLRDNLPECRHPVVVHGDYRPGNFLFDPPTRKITAILDWELAHIGDYHEDLAFVVQSGLSTMENGQRLACGLLPREVMIERYQALTGFPVCPRTLRFYEVLVRYKIYVMMLSTCIRAAQCGHFHQDTHVTWLAGAGHLYQAELCEMLLEEIAA